MLVESIANNKRNQENRILEANEYSINFKFICFSHTCTIAAVSRSADKQLANERANILARLYMG